MPESYERAGVVSCPPILWRPAIARGERCRLAWPNGRPRALPRRRAPGRRAGTAAERPAAGGTARRRAPPHVVAARPDGGRCAERGSGGVEPARDVVLAARTGQVARGRDADRA